MKPAAVREAFAPARVLPVTSGTVAVFDWVVLVAASVVVGDGPLETIMVTVEPLAALAPPGGLVLMTRPACIPARCPRLIDCSDQWIVKLDVTRMHVLMRAT